MQQRCFENKEELMLDMLDGETDPNAGCLKSSVDLFFSGLCTIAEILRFLLWLI
jgi:hypothetical protein